MVALLSVCNHNPIFQMSVLVVLLFLESMAETRVRDASLSHPKRDFTAARNVGITPW